jgi:hypothetical protein
MVWVGLLGEFWAHCELHWQSRLPKLNFPEFTGENPRLWISRCENYFDMYEVESYRWIQIASMYLIDAAARWFQSVHHRLKSASWHEFATLLLDRFGREQKELLIRQLYHIKQSGTVAEYVEKFAELVDQLTAYGHVIEQVYYAMRFVDGLRDDIRAPVSLHRPLDFDTAASLALLQEDVGSNFRTSRKHDYSYGGKSVPKEPQPLPPPPRIDKVVSAPVLAEEKKICECKTPEERMAALRAFRRAKGLCIHCAKKWHRDHKCSPTVQLHVVQELLEVFQLDDIDHLSATTENVDRLFVALSKEAVSGQDGPRTMRLQGIIQGKPLLILIDSGNTHTFISQALSSSLQRTSQMFTDIQVKVANGSILHCTSVLKATEWSVDDFSFTSDLKVLPLCNFDMILLVGRIQPYASPLEIQMDGYSIQWVYCYIARG